MSGKPRGCWNWIGRLARCGLLLTVVGGALGPLGANDARAASLFATRLAGTYFLVEGSPPDISGFGLLTLTPDGTALVASSSQGRENFGEQHGAWQRVPGTHKIRLTTLSFDFGDPGEAGLDFILRIDLEIDVAVDFQAIDGTFNLTFFEPGEDPLNPDTPPAFVGLPITGTRVTATPAQTETPEP